MPEIDLGPIRQQRTQDLAMADEQIRCGMCCPCSRSTERWDGDKLSRRSNPSGSWPWLAFRGLAVVPSSDESADDSGVGLLASISARDFLNLVSSGVQHSCPSRTQTDFLRLLSVTMHSTWSRRQLVQGEPFSTTSQRTFLARQQQQAREARRLMGRLAPGNPAVDAFRLFWGSVSVGPVDAMVKVSRRRSHAIRSDREDMHRHGGTKGAYGDVRGRKLAIRFSRLADENDPGAGRGL